VNEAAIEGALLARDDRTRDVGVFRMKAKQKLPSLMLRVSS
jgi:hypothetical protein